MERDHFEDPGVNGKIIKMDLEEMEYGRGLNSTGSE
jgi:hypothetical protein